MEFSKNTYEDRPWGHFVILAEDKFAKIKRISVLPNQKLSYQMHYKRNEVWTFVQGSGYIVLDDNIQRVAAGSVIQIPVGQKHRVVNDNDIEPLVFIEVQHGEYFGEDDIVRFEDSYGRV